MIINYYIWVEEKKQARNQTRSKKQQNGGDLWIYQTVAKAIHGRWFIFPSDGMWIRNGYAAEWYEEDFEQENREINSRSESL